MHKKIIMVRKNFEAATILHWLCLGLVALFSFFTIVHVNVALGQPLEESSVLLGKDNEIVLRGVITPQMKNNFFSRLTDATRAVVVSIGGGDGKSAIEIGEEISHRNLAVIVEKYCLSACAHFIFTASKTPEVREGSIVAFHNTSSSMLAMLGANKPQPVYDFLKNYSELELKYYNTISVSNDLLFRPQLEVKTLCYQYATDSSGVIDVQYKSIYNLWIPSKAYLRSVGISVKGFWPDTASDVIAPASKIFRPDLKVKISLSQVAVLNAKSNEFYLQAKECSSAN